MASPIKPAPSRGLTLINEIAAAPVIRSETLADSTLTTTGRDLSDAALLASPGSWSPPADRIAPARRD